MVKTTVVSMVTEPAVLSVREVPIPQIGDDAGLLRVEATGVCGTDVRDLPRPELPRRIMGHEIVGTVEALGAAARARWGLAEGDRVLLEEYLPCGSCRLCRSGEYRLCQQTDILTNRHALRYGATGVDIPPGLWGGYSRHVFLHPNAVFHRVPAGLEPGLVPLAVPMSNGYEWMYRVGRVGPSEGVVIIGPGQQGLCCLLAAKIAGAGPIVVAGLTKDTARLALASEMGADQVVNVEETSLTEVVRDVTSGRMADLAIDVAVASEATLGAAIAALGKGGRLVIGARNDNAVRMPVGDVRGKALTVTGVRGHSHHAVAWALRALGEHAAVVNRMSSGVYGLADLDQALAVTADGSAIHVRVEPWA